LNGAAIGEPLGSGEGVVILLLLSLLGAHEDLELQISRITKQIEQEPARAILYFRRAELHRLHEDWPAAREDLARAAARDPELAAVDLALGRVCNLSGDFEAARSALDRFVARRPDHAEARIERARARARLGDRTGAVEDYTAALSRMEEPWAQNYLERSEVLRAGGKLDDAIRGLEEGVRKIGPALPLMLALLDLELETGRMDAALKRLETIAAAAERKDLWLVRRGEILRQAGRDAEARKAFQAAVASIDALPVSRRKTRFTQDLELRARNGLEATHEKR
jgi:tetratricopeptide (TPR) repeat protein